MYDVGFVVVEVPLRQVDLFSCQYHPTDVSYSFDVILTVHRR